MKLKALLFTLIFSSTVFAAPFKSVTEAETKLATYTVDDIDGDKQRVVEGKPLKIDEIFDDLEAVVTLLEKDTLTVELAYQLERACLLASLHDPSNYAVDIILSVYQKNKETFKKAAEKLHSFDRKNLLEVFKGKDGEANGDNG